MNEAVAYVCKNCITDSASLPAQWNHAGVHVRVKLIPCSGKIDAQYMLHSFEGGLAGICIVACPEGKCKLSQGNYRAKIRIATVRSLLGEIGINPEKARIVQCADNETAARVKELIDETVGSFADPIPAAS
jgi:coenzyme F420-reducing hydrogenase delta subunit